MLKIPRAGIFSAGLDSRQIESFLRPTRPQEDFDGAKSCSFLANWPSRSSSPISRQRDKNQPRKINPIQSHLRLASASVNRKKDIRRQFLFEERVCSIWKELKLTKKIK